MPGVKLVNKPAVTLTLVVMLATTAIAHESTPDQIAVVTRLIQASPANASFLLRRADLHRQEGEWSEAQADYEATARLDPRLDIAWLGLGGMLLEAGRPADAVPALQTFLTFRPESAEGSALLGRALTRTLKHAEAVAAFTRSIGYGLAEGTRPEPDVFLDRARSQMGLGEINGALVGLAEGAALLDHPITLELASLAIETEHGRTEAAIRRLDRLASQSRRPERWLLRKGALLEESGSPEAAVTTYLLAKEAIKRLPRSRRMTSAMTGMEQEIDDALARLNRPADGEGP